MPPGLRLVTSSVQDEHALTYVVSRTRLVRPGTPYVIGSLVDQAMAADYRFDEVEMYRRAEMGADGRLVEALRAWDAGDHELFYRDREAHRRIEDNYRSSVLRSSRRHPSVLGRAGGP
jgi:hypothetical protein